MVRMTHPTFCLSSSLPSRGVFHAPLASMVHKCPRRVIEPVGCVIRTITGACDAPYLLPILTLTPRLIPQCNTQNNAIHQPCSFVTAGLPNRWTDYTLASGDLCGFAVSWDNTPLSINRFRCFVQCGFLSPGGPKRNSEVVSRPARPSPTPIPEADFYEGARKSSNPEQR